MADRMNEDGCACLEEESISSLSSGAAIFSGPKDTLALAANARGSPRRPNLGKESHEMTTDRKNDQTKANPERRAEGASIAVMCAFCRGTGKDPFGIMSPAATCQVCRGRGVRTLDQPTATCAYCEGTGVHPSSRLTCTTCGGTGKVEIPDDAVACPRCRGTGRESNCQYHPESLLSCWFCGGRGVVAAERKESLEEARI